VIAAPILALSFGHFGYFFALVAIAAVVVYRHAENIKRLRSGIEDKINF
jgi:glycerol-3-phosphate acyltransferase PlsY